MSRKKRRIGIRLFVLLVLLGAPVGIVYRDWKQAKRDNALLDAIEAGNNRKALEALAEGANGEARYGVAPTFREALRNLLGHMREPGKKDEEEHPSALILLYMDTWDLKKYGSGPPLALVRALLDHGARVDDRGVLERSPLFYASLFPNREAVGLLLEHGADIEAKDIDGRTPLMVANHSEETSVLLEHGACMDAVDKEHKTPLIWAASYSKLDVVSFLLKHGAKVGAKDVYGKTAIDYARDNAESYP